MGTRARARHYGSEKIAELEIGNHVIGKFKEKPNTLVLLQQLLTHTGRRFRRKSRLQRPAAAESTRQ
jgi:hypothetical protein